MMVITWFFSFRIQFIKFFPFFFFSFLVLSSPPFSSPLLLSPLLPSSPRRRHPFSSSSFFSHAALHCFSCKFTIFCYFLLFRLKADLEKKDVGYEESIARLKSEQSKHEQELLHQIQDWESKYTEAFEELENLNVEYKNVSVLITVSSETKVLNQTSINFILIHLFCILLNISLVVMMI